MIPTWVSRYMDLPWDAVHMNCWSLVQRIFREQFKIELPSYAEEFAGADDAKHVATSVAVHSQEWVPVDKPQCGDVILFRIYNLPQHVGVVVDPDAARFLHLHHGINSSIELWTSTLWRHRRLGFFRHPLLVNAT